MKANPSTKQGLNGSGPAEDRPGVFLPVAAFALMTLCWSTSNSAERPSDDKKYFNIPQQRADLSLTQFAEQAGLTLLFKFNIAKRKTANNLTGHYTVKEAVEVLLADTGLHPVFSDQGQLMSISDDMSETEGSSMDTKKKLGLIAIIAGALSGGVEAQEPTATETEIQTSVVTGTVTDARTGANLKGAKVTIEETGQWTSTGDLGRFRFASVSQGEYTLTVSFLGYAGQSAAIGVRGDSVAQDFALRGGSEIEEIVVFGQRSARAVALNQQRTAQNNSVVVSSDLLGQFSSTNLADSLRRAPGVSFIQEPRTGQALDISVRGLTQDLNSVQLNGISIPGAGGTRFADISGVLTGSIESVTISKSLMPSQETNGTGGLIEIETKTPLDRPDQLLQFGYERGDGINDTVNSDFYTATASRKFLDQKNLGFSISAQFSDEEISGASIGADEIFGSYLPSGISRTTEIDPRIPFPFIGGDSAILAGRSSFTISDIDRDRLNLALSAAYMPSSSTTIRADYVFAEYETTASSSNVAFNPQISFSERPVGALGGELRNAAEWTESFTQTRTLTLSPAKNTTHSGTLRANSQIGRWEVESLAGFSERTQDTTGRFSASFRHRNRSPDLSLFDPGIVDDVEGVILTPLDAIAGIPLFSQSGYGEYADADQIDFTSGSFNDGEGEDSRWHFETDVRVNNPAKYIDYVAVGVDIEHLDLTSYNDRRNISGVSTLGVVGLSNGFNAFFADPSVGEFRIPDPSGADAYRDYILENSGVGGPFSVSEYLGDPLSRETFTKELNIDYYLEVALDWRDFELVGGVRVATTDVETAIASSPSIVGPDFAPLVEVEERLRGISVRTADRTDVLPRVLLNYRPNDKFVARAGFYRTVSPPPLGFVGGLSGITLILAPIFGDGTQNFGFFVASNPAIAPASTDNFDLGAEYYFDNGGVVKANVFYKAIDNLQETLTIGDADPADIGLPDDSIFDDLLENPEDYAVTVLFPRNNSSISSVWGAEFEYEQQFTMLPGAFSGLGFFMNALYTDSEKDETVSFQGEEIEITGVKFQSQPLYSGSLGATYNYGNFDASIAYNFQDRTFGGSGEFGLDEYTSSFDTLDFRIEYFANSAFGDWRVFIEGADLLRGDGEANIRQEFGGDDGVPTIKEIGGTFRGGRTIRVGVLATF